jgi:MoxR-like ATPase
MADTLIEKGNPISGDLTAEVRACREVDQPLLVFGSPGVGKSDQIRASADEDDLVIDLRLNSLEAIDMRGLPIIKKDENKNPVAVEWVRPEFLPSEGGIVANGRLYKKGIVFLDELNTAQPSVQNPALQLVLDRKIGKHELPRSWYICAAANRAEDRAHTYPLSAALLDRFAIYDYSPDHHHWTKWAMMNAGSPRCDRFHLVLAVLAVVAPQGRIQCVGQSPVVVLCEQAAQGGSERDEPDSGVRGSG